MTGSTVPSADGETTADLLMRMQDVADPGESLRLATVHRHADHDAADGDDIPSRRERRHASHGGVGGPGGTGGGTGGPGAADAGGRRQGPLCRRWASSRSCC